MASCLAPLLTFYLTFFVADLAFFLACFKGPCVPGLIWRYLELGRVPAPLELALAVISGSGGAHIDDELAEGGRRKKEEEEEW